MLIRQMKEQDRPEIIKMMQDEGCNESLEFMNENNTYVLEQDDVIGFFNFKFEHNFPSLRHFCIRKDKRNSSNARRLIMFYRELMKEFKMSIVNSDKEYTSRIIEKYFKVKPYSRVYNTDFFLVEV